jgi:hypothetical protein
MRTKGSWRRAVTWRFLWWVSGRPRSRRTGLLQVLLAEVVDDHGGQERDELSSLFRAEGHSLWCGQREHG